jgi:precorrin-6A/cobalt-precorrin-6A reductase
MKDFSRSQRPAAGQIAILGGSAEARDIADQLAGQGRLWLPSRDRVTGQTKSSDFGHWAQNAAAVVIAPHPCDVDSFMLGHRTALGLDLPSLTVMRPPWRPTHRDRWVTVGAVSDAAAVIPTGSRVLVTLGRAVMPEMSAFRQAHAFVRQLVRHDRPFPLRHGRFVFGDAPFTGASEIALMRRFRIDAVLTRNAGGDGGWPKIAAARALRIPVYMVARDAVPFGRRVTSARAAVQWSEARAWLDV